MKSAAEQAEPGRAESGSCRDYGSSSADSGKTRWKPASEGLEVNSTAHSERSGGVLHWPAESRGERVRTLQIAD